MRFRATEASTIDGRRDCLRLCLLAFVSPTPHFSLGVCRIVECVATYKVFDDNASLALDRVLEADDDHSVTVGTTAPASGSILSTDPSDFDETEIACGADVVVAVIALGTVEASSRWWDRVGANVALGAEREGNMRFVERLFRRLGPGGYDGGKGGR